MRAGTTPPDDEPYDDDDDDDDPLLPWVVRLVVLPEYLQRTKENRSGVNDCVGARARACVRVIAQDGKRGVASDDQLRTRLNSSLTTLRCCCCFRHCCFRHCCFHHCCFRHWNYSAGQKTRAIMRSGG